MSARLTLALSLVLAGAPLGCKTGNVAQRLADSTAPTLAGSTQGRCKPGSEAAKPLVVEWPMSERAALEGKAKQGLVAVRYRDCEMEVINTCSVQGSYTFIGVTPKSETIAITNADELYAKIPIGAVNLEGQLERSGELNVDMTLIGRHEADRYRFELSELEGRCEGATHVVTGMSVGAFVFYSGAAANIGVGGELEGSGVGAGAGSTANKQVRNRDGDPAACEAAIDGAEAPPPGCGALLRVEVVPIDRPKPQAQPAYSSSSAGFGSPTNSSSSSAPPAGGQVAGETLTTDALDRQIKVSRAFTGVFIGIGAAGLPLMISGAYLTATEYAPQDLSQQQIGLAGSEDRRKYIANFQTSQILLFTGLGALVTGLPIGIAIAARNARLRNERSTRLAGIDVTPLPGAGAALSARWDF